MSTLPIDTAIVLDQFNQAFQRHEPHLLTALIADDCVLENTGPAPDGARFVGREACLAVWQAIASDREGRFDLEETRILGDHGIIFWRYWPPGAASSAVRGVNVMRVAHGRVVEARGYVKQVAAEAAK